MENQYLSSHHPFIQLLMFTLITVISVLVVMLLAIVAGIVLFRVPLTEWMNLLDVTDPANVPLLKFLQITQSLSMFVIPPIIFGWFVVRDPWLYLNINKSPDRKRVTVVLVLTVLILPVLNLLSVLNQELRLPGFLSGVEDWMKSAEAQAGDLTEAFLTVNTFSGYLVNVLMVVLIPAFGEEFFFRGVLQKIFHRWFRNPHVAIIFVAIIFSAFHMQFYGFLPRFVLGVLFGYLFFWSGNIWYPVLAHIINNFLPVTLTYFFRNQFDPAELDKIGTGPEAWIWAIPALVLSISAVVYFYRNSKTPKIYHGDTENTENHRDNG
ncbi:MAG: CPBP family intramembrane metalloprotease [Porphyromonadaceae bacterium]|nr:MAG: CPBP family intramembrane metalloprotease [Porphyromonadaceae bacterium]